MPRSISTRKARRLRHVVRVGQNVSGLTAELMPIAISAHYPPGLVWGHLHIAALRVALSHRKESS